MARSKTIVWSTFAEEDLNGIVDYLLENWDKKVTIRFIDLIDQVVSEITDHPGMYPLIHRKLRVRKCVLTKQNSLYYRVRRQQIEILRIYDNRQNPAKLRFSNK